MTVPRQVAFICFIATRSLYRISGKDIYAAPVELLIDLRLLDLSLIPLDPETYVGL